MSVLRTPSALAVFTIVIQFKRKLDDRNRVRS